MGVSIIRQQYKCISYFFPIAVQRNIWKFIFINLFGSTMKTNACAPCHTVGWSLKKLNTSSLVPCFSKVSHASIWASLQKCCCGPAVKRDCFNIFSVSPLRIKDVLNWFVQSFFREKFLPAFYGSGLGLLLIVRNKGKSELCWMCVFECIISYF